MIIVPGIPQMLRVDLRVVTMDVPPQDVISRDNVSVKVDAVVFFRVVDPQGAIIQVENDLMATREPAPTTLRVVLGTHELAEMLAVRERLNLDVQCILDAQTDAWGIKVTNVEVTHVDQNESMVRAIARQAETERQRRAKVIRAVGEKQAASTLLEAAQMLARQPEAMQPRYLQAMRRSPAIAARRSCLRCRSTSFAIRRGSAGPPADRGGGRSASLSIGDRPQSGAPPDCGQGWRRTSLHPNERLVL